MQNLAEMVACRNQADFDDASSCHRAGVSTRGGSWLRACRRVLSQAHKKSALVGRGIYAGLFSAWKPPAFCLRFAGSLFTIISMRTLKAGSTLDSHPAWFLRFLALQTTIWARFALDLLLPASRTSHRKALAEDLAGCQVDGILEDVRWNYRLVSEALRTSSREGLLE